MKEFGLLMLVALLSNNICAQTPVVEISINPNKKHGATNRNILGVNATTYTGNYLEDEKLMQHLRILQPSLIRFPGGDASNIYFFNDLPNDLPEKALTYNGKWTDFTAGSDLTNWKMNTQRYYELLEKTAAGGFITINYAYARYGTSHNPVAKAASLAADWVRYDKGRTKYWEVGNETYACWEGGFRIDTATNKDGQPEYINGRLYGRHFRVIADSMRKAAKQIGVEIKVGAVFADSDDVWDGSGKGITKNWNRLLVKELQKPNGSNYADFISVHSYFLNKGEKEPADIIDSYKVVDELQAFVYSHLENTNVEKVPIVLSEWNIKPPRQTTQVGALQAVAAMCRMQGVGFEASMYFGIKDHWRDKDGDFGLFAHKDPNHEKSEPYPTFYHFYFLNQVLGDFVVDCKIKQQEKDVVCFASSFKEGGVGVVLLNKSGKTQKVKITLDGRLKSKKYTWFELSGEGKDVWTEKLSINGVSNPENSKGGPADHNSIAPCETKTKKGLSLQMKGLSAIYILVE